MLHKITYTDEYVLILGNEVSGFENNIMVYLNGRIFKYINTMAVRSNNKPKIILAHRPLDGQSFLEGVDLLPKTSNNCEEEFNKTWLSNNVDYNSDIGMAFKLGYDSAKEVYQYDEEDLSIALSLMATNTMTKKQILNEFRLSRQPKYFECEMRSLDIDEIRERGKGFMNVNNFVPKTKTVNHKQKEWVGFYTNND